MTRDDRLFGERVFHDRTPGVEHEESGANVLSYTAGLGLAILLTIASFVVSQTNLLWEPGVAVGLVVLAFAQIGVHLVFFFASRQRSRQHQQYHRSGVRPADCLSRYHRLGLDHRQPPGQHDADTGGHATLTG